VQISYFSFEIYIFCPPYHSLHSDAWDGRPPQAAPAVTATVCHQSWHKTCETVLFKSTCV